MKTETVKTVVSRSSKLGFTNRLAIVLIILLTVGLAGSFLLAYWSIKYQYVGALACWTVCFTPLGTALGIVLGKIVDKSKAENMNDGKGIVYAAAEATNFNSENAVPQQGSIDSPAI